MLSIFSSLQIFCSFKVIVWFVLLLNLKIFLFILAPRPLSDIFKDFLPVWGVSVIQQCVPKSRNFVVVKFNLSIFFMDHVFDATVLISYFGKKS